MPDAPGGARIGSGDYPWGDLYLYDGNVPGDPTSSSAIYFTNPEDGGVHDVEILHDPTKGIRVKGNKQLQFNTANSYIHGSGILSEEILHLVAPTLNLAGPILNIQGLSEDGEPIAVNLTDGVSNTDVNVDGDLRAEQIQAASKIFVGGAIEGEDYEFTLSLIHI